MSSRLVETHISGKCRSTGGGGCLDIRAANVSSFIGAIASSVASSRTAPLTSPSCSLRSTCLLIWSSDVLLFLCFLGFLGSVATMIPCRLFLTEVAKLTVFLPAGACNIRGANRISSVQHSMLFFSAQSVRMLVRRSAQASLAPAGIRRNVGRFLFPCSNISGRLMGVDGKLFAGIG